MFFADRLRSIKNTDRVLEIGPGSSPHPRADLLLELRYESSDEYKQQCGDDGLTVSDPRVVYYDGRKFPFEDNQFDYVICSHVLEHIQDVEFFCSEMFRVAKKGYFEYPLVYYEFLYDFPVHLNILKWHNGALFYARKNIIFSPDDAPVRKFWRQTLNAGYDKTIQDLVPYIMEGFEWDGEFGVFQTNKVEDLCHKELNIETAKEVPVKNILLSAVKNKIKSIIGKF